MSRFLPITTAEMEVLGWDRPDFVCVTGDAYVDHPSFGVAVIARVLEAEGFRVAVLAQPVWRNTADFMKFGRPRLGFMVTSGNIDSMVAHYSVGKNRRKTDSYSPGGQTGLRPDRALIPYCRRIREAYGDIPIVIGGLEASLRRFAHYDYWEDAVRPSILVDTGADLLSYGMGEHQTIQIARRLAAGEDIRAMHDIPGTCYLTDPGDLPAGEAVSCASYDRVRADKLAYAKACKAQIEEQDAVRGRPVLQRQGDRLLVQNPPMKPLSRPELDRVAELPYTREIHPSYAGRGVPALQEVEFSIIHNRGCYGECAFCAIAFHQGRTVTSRSRASIVREAELLTRMPGFKGYIHDIGGPTANFRRPSCGEQLVRGVCKDRRCLSPEPCPHLVVDHREYLDILRTVRALPGVKRVFIRSGIRYDYLMLDPDPTFLEELCAHHVSGQLKVAPEHVSNHVLRTMGKPPISVYLKFCDRYFAACRKAGKEQYLVPYLISSHPGSTLKDAIELAVFLKRHHIRPEQVQDFYPTPGTPATCMFYTGLDPHTLREVFVPRDPEEKAMQRALLQTHLPENRALVLKALRKAGRTDLIGRGGDCLIDAPRGKGSSPAPAAGRNKRLARPANRGRNPGRGRRR